ncbi:DNA polymerase III subunit delta [Algivirga pacifica]|uniref:DNA polymerase III subunit delta n=1 Tax=Algivirga pacifica TaxID=1162670 RepID=A0ABP9DG64_9BACT
MKFSQIPGLEDLKKVLIKTVDNSHIAHAQLFLGNEGGANLALALAYATYVNCLNKQPEDSCGECSSCRKFNKLIHPDLHFIIPTATTKAFSKRSDAISERFLGEWREFIQGSPYRRLYDWSSFFGAENKQCIIPKEESRSIIKALSIKAFEAEYKVMLIWLPELMQAPAANAILKILEEPPAKTLFLLVSNNINLLLPTIISRTQIVQVRNFNDQEIIQYLKEEKHVSSTQAEQIAFLADGNLRKAVELLDESGDEVSIFFQEWMRSCFKMDLNTLIQTQVDAFNTMGKESQKNLLLYALNTLREAMLYKYADESLVRIASQKTFIENFSKVINENNLPQLTEVITDAHFYIERNANPKITFLALSIKIARIFRGML